MSYLASLRGEVTASIKGESRGRDGQKSRIDITEYPIYIWPLTYSNSLYV
jgi:hypothetical protein